MNATIPSLGQFQLNTLDHAILDVEQAQVSFRVNLEHESMTDRLVVGLMDENNENGVAVAIYPATGEVCDLANGGGVIGYLSSSPLLPHEMISCEILLYKFGGNCVCSVRVSGETFLYPAFMLTGSTQMRSLVGSESGQSNAIVWDGANISVNPIEKAA